MLVSSRILEQVISPIKAFKNVTINIFVLVVYWRKVDNTKYIPFVNSQPMRTTQSELKCFFLVFLVSRLTKKKSVCSSARKSISRNLLHQWDKDRTRRVQILRRENES